MDVIYVDSRAWNSAPQAGLGPVTTRLTGWSGRRFEPPTSIDAVGDAVRGGCIRPRPIGTRTTGDPMRRLLIRAVEHGGRPTIIPRVGPRFPRTPTSLAIQTSLVAPRSLKDRSYSCQFPWQPSPQNSVA